MEIFHSDEVPSAAVSPSTARLLETLSESELRSWVEKIAHPRHFTAEPQQNRATAQWLVRTFESFGYRAEIQGDSQNVIAQKLATPRTSGEDAKGGSVLIGAHFDSVPGCAGADDNASAVAALLGCAAALAQEDAALPVIFVGFNREEDGFMGSHEFVEEFLFKRRGAVRCAHILEMLGYASAEPGSQHLPTGLPIKLRDTGDFLGLLANDQSAGAMQLVLATAGGYTPDLPVTGLKVVPGAERAFPVLARSDHVPFWFREIPALMWTDTAEFRNPHYHQATDTPETLNYPFLLQVTRLLTVTVLSQVEPEGVKEPPR